MIVRIVVGWFAILAVAIANGGLRDRVIRPRFGAFAAEAFGASVLSLAVIVAALIVLRPMAAANWQRAAWQLSASWLVMTVAFEFLFFHYVGGHSWSELLAAYRFWEGRLWSVVLLVVAVAPFAVGRWLAGRTIGAR